MNKPNSIFNQVQEIICDQLNSDETLSSATILFVAENAKDIDYEVTNALGKQGIVGVVMTPKADYIGITSKGELAYELRGITVQIVENVPVNRGLPNTITALDAAQRVQEVLSSPMFTKFGVMNPVSIEQGEESGLIVCQAKFNCSVHAVYNVPVWFPERQAIKMSDGTVIPMGDGFFSPTGYDINTTLRTLGYTVNDVEEIYVFSKLDTTTSYSSHLKAVYIDSSCPSIGRDYWSQPFSSSSIEKVVFKGRTYGQIAQMQYFPWGLADLTKIIALDDTITPTKVKYTEASGLPYWESDIVGRLSADSLPDKTSMQSIDIGNRVFSIGYGAFSGCSALTSVTIPSSVTYIETQTFSTCTNLMDVTFVDKDMATVQGMSNYSWRLPVGCVLHCTDGDITILDYSKLLLWKDNGDMVEVVAPASVTSTTIEQAVYPSQRSVITKAHIPDTVSSIGYGAFYGCD